MLNKIKQSIKSFIDKYTYQQDNYVPSGDIMSDMEYYAKVIKPKDEVKLFRSEKWSPEITTVEVWYGDGDCSPLGLIEAEIVGSGSTLGGLKVKILDPFWIDHIGAEPDDVYHCEKMSADRFVGRDSYAWCCVGESGLQPTKWW